MSKAWPLIPLGQVLMPVSRPETLSPEMTYHILGAHWYAEGLYTKEVKPGSQIQAAKLYRVEEGDFVYNRLFAWKGSFAIASKENHGCYVSNEFPCFAIRRDRADGQYLWRYFSRASAWDEALSLSTGGTPTSRNRLKEEKLLAMAIPLPSLAEQRRIVARINERVSKIEEAYGLRLHATEKTRALLPSTLHQFFEVEAKDWAALPMHEAVSVDDAQVDPTLPEYSCLPHISGENIESKTCKLLPYRTAEQDSIRSGNYLFSQGTILYSKIRPYLQKATFVDFQGLCSADIYPIKVINERLSRRFVMWSLIAGPFTSYANRLSGRTRMPKLNRKQLFGFPLSHPPMDEQHRIVSCLDEAQAKVDALKRLQAETAAELDALLPSILDKAFKGDL